MKLTRLDDYQSWLIEESGKSLLIDPWLVGDMQLPPGQWMYLRKRPNSVRVNIDSIPAIDGMLVSSHFADHLHKETLRQLDKALPVLTTPVAARMLRRIGFTGVDVLNPGAQLDIGENFRVSGIKPGFPYSHNSIGFLIEGKISKKLVYFEPHAIDERNSKTLSDGIDAVVAPIELVRFLGVKLTMGPEKLVRVLSNIAPRYFLPTGLFPEKADGFMPRFLLSYSGSSSEFATQLRAGGSKLDLPELITGEPFSLESREED